MDVWFCLIEMWPLDPTSGERHSILVCSADDRRITAIGGRTWQTALQRAPQIAIRYFNGDYKDAVSPASARFVLTMEELKAGHDQADKLDWSGAPVSIHIGKANEAWPWRRIFYGRVQSYTRQKQNLNITAEVDTEPFEKDILTATYAGTTGIEGGADLANKVKPLVIGHAKNVAPVLINAIDNIYQFSAYGAIEEVTTLFERGSDFGPSLGDHPTYTDLLNATIAPGRWATCLAEGLIRLGAPQAGVITGDIKGHVVGTQTPRLTGQVISALAAIAGVDTNQLSAASLSALDADKPYPINLVLSVQEDFLSLAKKLALACNHQAGVSLTGQFFAVKPDFDRLSDLRLDAQGRALPLVTESNEQATSPPFHKTVMGAARSWRVHTTDEIAFTAVLVERGTYDAESFYKEGDIVSSADKSRWVYINPTPGGSVAPPTWPATSNTHWSSLQSPVTADDVTYADGNSLEYFKPAAPQADVTLDSQITFKPVAMFQIQADSENQTTSVLPMTRKLVLQQGGVDIAAGVTFSLVSVSAGSEASISGDVLTLSQADASGQVVVQASFSDVAQQMSIPIQRSAAGAPVGGLAGAIRFSDTILNNVSSGTLQQVTDDGALVRSDTNGDISFSLTGQYQGAGQIAVQFRISADNTTFTDVGAEVVGSLAYFNDFPEPGFISAQAVAGGLTPDTDYYVAAFARRSSGSGTLAWQDTIFTAKQP